MNTVAQIVDAAKELLTVIEEGPEPPDPSALHPYRDWEADIELAAERLREALLCHELIQLARGPAHAEAF